MQSEAILSAAVESAMDAWKREQWEAVPYILAGYASALLQTSMMARVFRYNDDIVGKEGNIISESPTRIKRVVEAQPVKPLKLVCRPAISLQTGLTEKKVRDVCSSLLTGADRLLYNLVRQKVEVLTPDQIQGLIDLNLFRTTRHNNTAFIGSSVPVSYAMKLAGLAIQDNGDPQSKVLDDHEMILACYPQEGLLGEYNMQPVKCRPVGYPNEKLPHLAIIEDDPEFPEGHEYRNSLQFNLVTELTLCLQRPAGFMHIVEIPE